MTVTSSPAFSVIGLDTCNCVEVNSAGILGDGPAGSVLIVRRHADRTAKQVHKWPRKEDDDVSSLSGFGSWCTVCSASRKAGPQVQTSQQFQTSITTA